MPWIHLGRQDVSIVSNQPEIFDYKGTVSQVTEVALSKVT